MQILIASGNQGKIAEIGAALQGCNVQLRSVLDLDPHFDPPETGATLRENAEIKARAALLRAPSHSAALADDTGLYVDALDGEPGLRAARYAGVHCSFEDNIAKLLAALAGVPPERRGARFVTVLALARPGAATLFFEGACAGRIAAEKHGAEGFGYDPIFFVPAVNKTFAEMSLLEKEAVSHRGAALRNFAAWLQSR
ncbi:MAG: RdgB/HAM1 family non-canonical purine NTP pyrophosphatase [Planctomycetota bacterium]